MYFARVPNRNSPPAYLPREGYREDGKVTRIGDRHNLWSSRRHTPLFPIPKAIPVGHHLGRRHGRWGLLAPFEPVSACNPVLFLSWRWSNSCISRCDKHRPDVDLRGQRSVDRTLVGDFQEPRSLHLVERPD
jgi:hypothetical protein